MSVQVFFHPFTYLRQMSDCGVFSFIMSKLSKGHNKNDIIGIFQLVISSFNLSLY